VVRVCASVHSFIKNCTKLFGTDKTGCWREALVNPRCECPPMSCFTYQLSDVD